MRPSQHPPITLISLQVGRWSGRKGAFLRKSIGPLCAMCCCCCRKYKLPEVSQHGEAVWAVGRGFRRRRKSWFINTTLCNDHLSSLSIGWLIDLFLIVSKITPWESFLFLLSLWSRFCSGFGSFIQQTCVSLKESEKKSAVSVSLVFQQASDLLKQHQASPCVTGLYFPGIKCTRLCVCAKVQRWGFSDDWYHLLFFFHAPPCPCVAVIQ